MKALIVLLILLVVGSCGKVQRKSKPPLPEVFKEIVAEKYIKHVNDCSNKSAKYLRALHANGYTGIIIVHKQVDMKNYHAVVEVNGIYVDPTRGIVLWERPKDVMWTVTIDEANSNKYGTEFR